MSYGPPQALYYIADALLCILFLVGIVAGIIAITRKRMLAGILAIVAFVLLGFQTLVTIILPVALWDVFANAGNYGTYNWIFFCLNTPIFMLAVVALVVLVFSNVGKKTVLPPPPGLDETPSEQ